MNRVLKIPAFRRLLAAYTLNELAFMVGSLALALLVYRRTGSALGAAGFFLSAQFVPALMSPLAVARLEGRPPRRGASGSVLVRGAGVPRPGMGGDAFLAGAGAGARVDRRTGGAHRSSAGPRRDRQRDLGGRPAARGERGRERRILGVLHAWSGDRRRGGGGRRDEHGADRRRLPVRRDRVDARRRRPVSPSRRRPARRQKVGCARRSSTRGSGW